jgi:hypothetical protein
MYKTQKMHLHIYMYFIINIYMFRSPSANILRVYSIMFEVQGKNLCMKKILPT